MAARKTASSKSARTKGAAPRSLHAGDAVAWESSQGTVEGTVVKTLTHPTKIKSHKVAASPENPEVLVRSDKTGALAAHKPASLRKRGRGK